MENGHVLLICSSQQGPPSEMQPMYWDAPPPKLTSVKCRCIDIASWPTLASWVGGEHPNHVVTWIFGAPSSQATPLHTRHSACVPCLGDHAWGVEESGGELGCFVTEQQQYEMYMTNALNQS